MVAGHGNRSLTIDDITLVDRKKLHRAVVAAALGNAMEWFDFGVYAYLASTLGKVFFPSTNPTAQILATFGAFAAAFVMRPVGAMILGPLGDRLGRQKILAFTIIIMSIATFSIGLIPDYQRIGIAAPVLLLLARMVQGFSAGGEYGGTATFIAEYSPDRHRGFMGSWLEFGTLGGYILGAAIVTLISSTMNEQMLLEWGWRLPFFFAGPLGMIGLYMRLKLEETPAFQEYLATLPAPSNLPKESLLSTIKGHLRPLIICVGLVMVYGVADTLLLSYMPTYLSSNLGYSPAKGLFLILSVMLIMMLIQPFMGKACDHFGRRPLVLAGCIGFFVLAIPSLLLIQSGATARIFLGLLLLGATLNCFTATFPSMLPALFPTAIRCGALSIVYNLTAVVFGGGTPMLTAWLIDVTGNLMVPAYYLMAATALGAITVLFTQETKHRPLEGSAPAAYDRDEAKELLGRHFDRIENEVDALERRICLFQEKIEELLEQHPELTKDAGRQGRPVTPNEHPILDHGKASELHSLA